MTPLLHRKVRFKDAEGRVREGVVRLEWEQFGEIVVQTDDEFSGEYQILNELNWREVLPEREEEPK